MDAAADTAAFSPRFHDEHASEEHCQEQHFFQNEDGSSFSVFHFRNDSSKAVKLLLLDDAEGVFQKQASRTSGSMEAMVASGRIRLVTAVIHARGQTEVPVRGRFILLTAGFRHAPEVYERVCEAHSYYWEPNSWITFQEDDMGLRDNTWWTDICLEGAEPLTRKGAPLRRRSAKRDTLTFQAKLSERSDSGSTSAPDDEGFAENSEEEEEEVLPESQYDEGQRVLVYSRHVGGWFGGFVEKVYRDGTVRVKFEGSYRKEVPLDLQDELLKPATNRASVMHRH